MLWDYRIASPMYVGARVKRLYAWKNKISSSIRDHLLVQQTSLLLCMACVVTVTAVLYWRRPDSFFRPQLWAEDGNRFFSESFFLGAKSLVVPFAGYYHTLARLIALVGRLVPVLYVPHWYHLAFWSLAVFVIGYMFSARLPFSNGLKFLLGLAMVATTADNEVFMNLAALSFFIVPLWLLLAVSSDPRSRLQAVFDVVVLVLVGLSSPFVVSLWPVFLMRWGVRRSKSSLYLAVLSLEVALIQAWNMPGRIGAGEAFLPPSPMLIDVLVYWFGFLFLGELVYRLTLTNALRVCVLLVVIGLYAYLVWGAAKKRNWAQLTILLGNVMTVTLSLYVIRHTAPHFIRSAGRHYFIPSVTFIWALLLSKAKPAHLERLLPAAAFIAFLFLTPSSKNDVFPDLDWAGHISRCTGTRRVCMIPINPVWDPPAWFALMDSHVFTVPSMQTTFYSTFESYIELLGYGIDQSSELSLNLVWRAIGTMRDDYRFFVHLYDPNEPTVILAQKDVMPLDGEYPTSIWVDGEVVVDHVRLALEMLETGSYQIAVGWYDPDSPTLDRLPAYDSQERVWGDNRVILPTMVIVP